MDVPNLGRIGVDPMLPIFDNRAILPTGFPQLVADLEIFVGDFVALVVLR